MASIAVNATAAYLPSKDGKYRLLNRKGYTQEDQRFLHLNDIAETILSNILRHGYDIDREDVAPPGAQRIKRQIETWAIHMAQEIPGYNDWPSAYRFTWTLMTTSDAVPDEDTTPVGTERDLHDDDDLFNATMRSRYALGSEAEEEKALEDHDLALETARRRQTVLDTLRERYRPDAPMPDRVATLFRKIYYAYSLREKLIGQTGYYNGSLELKAGLSQDFEYNMYLIQMKLRRPDRLFPFKAPKQMSYYRTGVHSESPWNLQFSASFGFDEFGPGQTPHLGTNYIERRLVEVLRADDDGKKWKQLCSLLHLNPDAQAATTERDRLKSAFVPVTPSTYVLPRHLCLSDCGLKVLTLENIVRAIGNDEVRLKAFFTLFLQLTWSDTPMRRQDNPFAQTAVNLANEAAPGRASFEDALCHLRPSDIKDPRIADPDRPALASLNEAKLLPNVVGRRANFVLDPQTTAADYRMKLQRMSEKQLDHLFRNITAYPGHLSHEDKVSRVVEQAVTQSMIWSAGAIKRHRPIYTGPSSHVVTYAEICLDSPKEKCLDSSSHPNLEQIRLTLLAALIGSNQHHTYDECMFTSTGISHEGSTLRYVDRVGYRDLTMSLDPFVREVGVLLKDACAKTVLDAIHRFNQQEPAAVAGLPEWGPTGLKWFRSAFGEDLPGLALPPLPDVPRKRHPIVAVLSDLWAWLRGSGRDE